MRALRFALLALTLLACLQTCGAACSDDGLAPVEGNTCVSDDECGYLTACMLGVCVDPRAQRLDQVDLEIRPPEDSGYRPQQVFGVGVGPSNDEVRSVVRLRETILLRGNVVDTGGSAVPADVVAVPFAGIPGRALVASTASSGPEGSFTLPLVASDPARLEDGYRLTIHPHEAHARPPLYLDEALRVDAGRTGELSYGSVELSDVASLRTVTGRVITSDGSAELPVSGLEVRLFDGARRVSSVGLTGADGAFSVSVPPEAPLALTLEVRPTEQSRLNPIVRTDVSDVEAAIVVDLGPLEAPVPFTGVVRGPTGEPVAGARIYAHKANGEAVLRVLTVADEEGRYDGELRPGRYTFAVLPPASDSSAGLLVNFEANVGAAASPSFNLPERLDVAGQVNDAEGAPVPGAEVTFTRIASVTGVPERALDGVAWSFQALTDGSGGFSLQLDPGRYRVLVIPDPGSGLPRQTRVLDVADASADVELTLPAAALIAGALQTAHGDPLVGAQVTAFSTIVGETGEPFELGAALSSEDGRFEIVLPDLDVE